MNAELWSYPDEHSQYIKLTSWLKNNNISYTEDMTIEELRQLYIDAETGKLYICRKNERCTALSHDNSLYSAQYDGKPYCNSGYGYWKCNPQYGRTFVSGTRCCASYRRVGSPYERGERLSPESTMDYRF